MGIDLFGASVMSITPAFGGGTLSDVILGVPVFWATDLNYIWVAIVSSVVAFYAYQFMERKNVYKLMLYLDGAGACLFAIRGADKVMEIGFAMPFCTISLVQSRL